MNNANSPCDAEQQGSGAAANWLGPRTRVSRYDAFISYSHSLDGRLAPALQTALHRFAKPWYRLRALRVFRDDASLSANSALWQSLENALQQSEWLILLASPTAAAANWVAKEVEFWGAHRTRERTIVVLTDGEIAWDSRSADFDWSRTTSLPATASGLFAEEPRIVDLRWVRAETDVSLANPRFVEAVADIAASVDGRPKDELVGDDVRQHARTRRIVAGTIAILSVLLLGTVLAAILAVQQRNIADTQARVATSRLLASRAINIPDEQLDVAFRLAAQGWAYQDNAQTRGSLVQTLLRSPHLLRYLPDTREATALTYADATDTFVVGTKTGAVTLWNGTTHQRTQSFLPTHISPVTRIAIDAAGTFVVSGHADGVVKLWKSSRGEPVRQWTLGAPISAVAFGRDSSKVLAAAENGDLQVWRITDGARVFRVSGVSGANPRLHLTAEDVLTIGDGQGHIARWTLSHGARAVEERRIGSGFPQVAAYSRDLQLYAGQTSGNNPYVTNVATGNFLHGDNLVGPAMNIREMAFSSNGHLLATVGDGRLQIWDVRSNRAESVPMSGVLGTATSIAFGRSDSVVAVASRGGVGLWDRRSQTLMNTLSPSGAKPTSSVPRVLWGAASVAFSHDGKRVAWSVNTSEQSWVVVWDIAQRVEVSRVEAEWVLGFSPDDTELLSSTDVGKGTLTTNLATGVSRVTTPSKPNQPPEVTQGQPWTVASIQGLGASVEASGAITLWDVRSAQPIARASIHGASHLARLAFDPSGRRLAISPPGGKLILIDTDIETWVARVCERASIPLGDTEWAQFVGDRPKTAPRACSSKIAP